MRERDFGGMSCSRGLTPGRTVAVATNTRQTSKAGASWTRQKNRSFSRVELESVPVQWTQSIACSYNSRALERSGMGVDGSTSCWGDVGAGDPEVDIIYILFIVSVQHIEY